MPNPPARRADNLPEYPTLLATIQNLLEQGRNEAYQRIDQIRARTYVTIGAEIIAAELRHQQRADYGRQAIAALAHDLGFSQSNLYNIVAVARVFTPDSLPMPMSWSHLVRLSGVANDDARHFYIDQILRHQWSVRYLEQQITSQLYERATSEGQLAPPPPGFPMRAQDVLRSSYTFDIPGLSLKKHTERELEAGLRANFERFLQELG
ncbi:MAG: DUF1016 domain-containing protein, partial [Oscillochloris sp.]|nr:DUF1016 domain-containing protein [Oscillochloris sp.]